MEIRMSPYNTPMNVPSDLIFCDVTMREGEQCPGVIFSLDEKKQLMRKLSDVGIDQIQFFPGKTEDQKELLKNFHL